MAEAAVPFQGAPPKVITPKPRPARVGVRLNRIGGAELIVPDAAALPRPLRDRGVKRALDVVLASVALLVLAPVMALIAFLLVVEGGAPIFRQSRVGRARGRFTCLKFRTMRQGAEARLEAMLASDDNARAQWLTHQKLPRDPRVTALGRFLRASSLDELPQLINVIRGEMSLVGPRPIIAPEVPGYLADRAYFNSPEFDDYAGCLPGITGLWQIAGRHRSEHSERVRLDGWYARNWSVVLDLAILWRTVGVVLSRSGG